jgi:hypothetical protein
MKKKYKTVVYELLDIRDVIETAIVRLGEGELDDRDGEMPEPVWRYYNSGLEDISKILSAMVHGDKLEELNLNLKNNTNGINKKDRKDARTSGNHSDIRNIGRRENIPV